MTAELLAMIWDAPHDDAPRRVYADHLLASGDRDLAARGELIALQCELARTSAEAPTFAALERRANHLQHAHGRTFRRGLPDRLRGFQFRRGFVAPVVKLTPHKLWTHYHALLDAAPTWDLTIAGMLEPALIERLAATPALARIERLRIGVVAGGRATASTSWSARRTCATSSSSIGTRRSSRRAASPASGACLTWSTCG